ncbi:hypothetical protein B566_EDAN001024 [Ephemera danica]|nr:hypothetical protein B566_EDAN001024 [Ephemera danica]
MTGKMIYSMQFFVISVLILQIQETKSDFFLSTSSLETNVSSTQQPRGLSVASSLDQDAALSTRTTFPATSTANVINGNNSSEAPTFVTQPVIQITTNNATLQLTSIAPNTSLPQSDYAEKDDSSETLILTQEISDNDKDIGTRISIVDVEDYTRRDDLEQRQRKYASVMSSKLLEPSESAAVLAAIFISVAIVAYVGLVLWRRMLDKHYGNRHLLVEEDYYDVNDLKFFEL